MLKTKPICKSLNHKDDRMRQQREERRGQRLMFGSDSDEDSSSGSLQELDFSCISGRQEDYSIESFIQNLQGEEGSYLQEETPEEDEDSDGYYYCGNGSALQRINAMYMQRIKSYSGSISHVPSIKFDSTVRVKFFSDQRPAAEICTVKQYAISQQYKQICDEDRLF